MAIFAYYSLLSLLIFVAVLLILLILIQKGRGGGLSSAFGGGGGSAAFGAKTGDVLTWATSIIFGIFILLAVALDLVVDTQYKSPPVIKTPVTPVAPVGTETNSPAPTPSPVPSPAPAPAPAPAMVLPSTQPTATSALGAMTKDLTKLAPVTQSAGATLHQTITNAATQGAATVKATTQPAGKLLKELK